MQKETLRFQPPHPLQPTEKTYIKQLTPKELELHTLATQMLGSSYFVGKTHGFRAWEAKQKQPQSK